MASTQRESTRRFLTGAVLLTVMAVFMRPAARTAAAAIEKRPVAIRKPLAEFDRSALSGFRFTDDEGVRSKTDVGTKEFIEWRLRSEALEIRQIHNAVLQVYYYTARGATPVVPHTPELCARQQGDQVVSMGEMSIPAAAGPAAPPIPVKFVRLIQTVRGSPLDVLVMYSFCVNGEFVADRERARLMMAMPWRQALYFATIQCVVVIPRTDDFDVAQSAASRLMSMTIQELMARHLPTDADLRSAR